MSLHEASLRVKHECAYREISERHPDLTIREWPLSDCQVLEISAEETPTDQLLAEIDRLGCGTPVRPRERVVQDERTGRIVDRQISHLRYGKPRRSRRGGCHRQGWEHYTVIAFDEDDVQALLGDLRADRDIELLSKTAITEKRVPHSMLTPVDRLFDDLTDRQLAALQLALDSGYYEQPRRTSLREIAGQTSVAKSTYEEHLRKAENELLTNAGRFLRLVTATASTNPLRPGRPGSSEQRAD